MSKLEVMNNYKINEMTVNMFKGLLRDAESGFIQSAAVTFTTNSATSGNCFSCEEDAVTIIGELRILERDIVDLNIDTRREPLWS